MKSNKHYTLLTRLAGTPQAYYILNVVESNKMVRTITSTSTSYIQSIIRKQLAGVPMKLAHAKA